MCYSNLAAKTALGLGGTTILTAPKMVQLIKSIETIRESFESLYVCFMSLCMLPLRRFYGVARDALGEDSREESFVS
jgi:hypothetical protein